MAYWTDKKEVFIAGAPAIQGGFGSNAEVGIIGERGELWESSPGVYAVWCLHSSAARLLGRSIGQGEECVVRTPDLRLACEAIQAVASRVRQARLANARGNNR